MIESILDQNPFSMDTKNPENFFISHINDLTRHHYQNCNEYKLILNSFGYEPSKNYEINQIPFLPVRIFKDYDMMSVHEENIFKIMKSSGTSGQSFSKIYLDKKMLLHKQRFLQKLFQPN